MFRRDARTASLFFYIYIHNSVDMTIEEFRKYMARPREIGGWSDVHLMFHSLSQRALKITSEINGKYHAPEELHALLEELMDRPLPKTLGMFPPFYTDCGVNTVIGENVFINMGCKFQDQGGIFIGDGTFIGHNTVLATLDHDIDPDKRHLLYPAPIHIGNKVWIGAGVIITKGITIGDNSVIAAGAVVTHDIPANVIAAGVPAKVLREI